MIPDDKRGVEQALGNDTKQRLDAVVRRLHHHCLRRQRQAQWGQEVHKEGQCLLEVVQRRVLRVQQLVGAKQQRVAACVPTREAGEGS